MKMLSGPSIASNKDIYKIYIYISHAELHTPISAGVKYLFIFSLLLMASCINNNDCIVLYITG